MIMLLIKVAIGAAVAVAVLAAGAILRNEVPLAEPPGVVKRLVVYLSRNTARTSLDHEFPELRTRTYQASIEGLLTTAQQAVADAGWELKDTDPAVPRLHAVVTTPWLRFKDDVRIRLEETSEGRTRVHIESSSRVGRADFGANVAHVIKYYAALDARAG